VSNVSRWAVILSSVKMENRREAHYAGGKQSFHSNPLAGEVDNPL
jgi:hypothetical protein